MRRLSLVAVVFALLTTYDVTRPMPTTASFGCAGSIGTRAHFAGTEEDHHNAVTGASARIEYVNEDLCTGVPIGLLSFSSAWVSVDGDDPIDVFGDDIYQIGYDDCRAGCAAGSTGNVPYYFWAYGRHASALCGDEMLPTAHFISNATAGLHLFSVFRLRVNNVDSWYAKLDGGTQAIWSDASIAGCWNGVGEVQIMNEVWDQNDQSGGPNSNRQNFESPLWHDASSWHPIVRAPASLCDFHQASTQAVNGPAMDPGSGIAGTRDGRRARSAHACWSAGIHHDRGLWRRRYERAWSSAERPCGHACRPSR